MKAVRCPVCVGDGQPIAEKGSPCCAGRGWVLVPEMEQPAYVPYQVPYRVWPPPIITWTPPTTDPRTYTVWYSGGTNIDNPNVGGGTFV